MTRAELSADLMTKEPDQGCTRTKAELGADLIIREILSTPGLH